MLRWAGHVIRMGKRRGVYTVLMGIPEGKRTLGRPRGGLTDNIEKDFQEMGSERHGLD